MPEPSISIRALKPEDRASWNAMWSGYLAFYDTDLASDVTDGTWRRVLSGEFIGLAACDTSGAPVGFAHALLHAGTWSPKPICYLEDLYVCGSARGQGAGLALIEALAERGRREGWLRLYWQTARGNERAQRLYDRLARRTSWLRYDLDL